MTDSKTRSRGPGLRVLSVGLLLTGIVPIVALMVYSDLDRREQARDRVGEEAARVGRLAALREADLIDAGREILAGVSDMPAVQSGDAPACRARLEILLPLYTRFANLGVVRPDGDLFCSAVQPDSPQNFGDRAWFRRAVETKQFAVGDYAVGRITGRPSLVFGLPVIGAGGALRGVAWAALDLGWLQQFAANVKLPGNPSLTITDREGTVLSRHPDPERWIGKKLPGLPPSLLADNGETIEAAGLDGVRRLHAFTTLGSADEPHAVIGVGIPTSAAYADADRALRRNLGLLGGITVLGLLTARLAAQRLILRPAEALVAVSKRLAAGDLDTRLGPPYGSGELGSVAQAFDDMASALEAHDAALLAAIAEREQSEARFRALLEAGPDAAVAIDGEGIIRLVNRRAESLFGWVRDDMVGRAAALLGREVSDAFGRHFGPEASGGCAHRSGHTLEVAARRSDGTTFPAEMTLAALETEEGLLVSAAVRDVSERKAAEEALARSQGQLQAILDNAPASISMKDRQGRYLLVNRRFEQLTGVDLPRIIGRTAEEVFGPETGRDIRTRDRQILEARMPVETEEQSTRDDGVHTYLSVKFPLCDASGMPYAVCGISTDITERLQAQAERQALEAQLQRVQRLESLGQLAGGVAHDFNNLLAVILNYADFVLDALPDQPPKDWTATVEGIRADVGAIRQAGESAAVLTRQLLIFGRRDTVQARLLDLGEVVTHVEPLLRRTLGEHLSLRFSLPGDLRTIRADAGRLEQVLMNLAVNARDAMEAGGTLTISAANVDLDAAEAARGGLAPGPHVRLEVADTGVGMPAGVIDRAFEPFFTTKPKGHGTGLGLATVFGIVTEAGGHVSIDSVPGRGTTVRVYLPALDASTGRGHSADEEVIPARSATVLVVEDEDRVREVAQRILAAEGYDVLCAADPLDALRLCQDDECTIDLVLTDVVMPGFSGPELVEKVRRFRPGIRALYMSGYPEDLLKHRHRFDEDVEVIGKPFTADSLLRMVGLALHQP